MEEYLIHYGVLGQKWGIRRYQNEDGSLTDAGRKRYGISEKGTMSAAGAKKYEKDYSKYSKKSKYSSMPTREKVESSIQEDIKRQQEAQKEQEMNNIRTSVNSNDYNRNSARDRVLNISNEDLKKTIERLELEKKYKELTTEQVQSGHEKYIQLMERIKKTGETAMTLFNAWGRFQAVRGGGTKIKEAEAALAGGKELLKTVKEEGMIGGKKSSSTESPKPQGFKSNNVYKVKGDHKIKKEKKGNLTDKVNRSNLRISLINLGESARHDDMEHTKYLVHYGIKGQHYGVRRFQNEDGSYTAAGKARYGFGEGNAQTVANLNTQNQYWRNRPGESGRGKTIYVSPTPDDYMMPVNERKYGRSMFRYSGSPVSVGGKGNGGKVKLTGDMINAKEVFRGPGNSRAARSIDARNSAPVGNNNRPNPLKNVTPAQPFNVNKPFNHDFNRVKKKYVNSELESARKDLLDAAAKRFGVNSPQYAALLEGSGGKNYTKDIGLGAVEAVSDAMKPHDSELTFDKNSEYDDKIVRKEYSDSKVTRQEDDAIARARDAAALDDYGKGIRKQARASQEARNKGKSKTAVSVKSSKADLRSAAKELLKNRKNSKQTK